MEITERNSLPNEDDTDARFAGDSELAYPMDGASSQLKRNELVSIWVFWGFIAVLTFINALINDATSQATSNRLNVIAPLTAAFIESLVWAMLTPFVFRLTRRYSLDRPRWLLSLVFLLTLGLVISVLMSEFMTFVRAEQAEWLRAPGMSPPEPVVHNDSVPIAKRFWFMNEFVIYLVVLASGFAHDYFSRYRTRNEQASALRAHAAHLRAELSDSRLHVLRSQLNPHFLFNTLNSISSLVGRDPRNARRMIACLSDLLRDTLEGNELEVTLEQELAFIRRYIEIMQARFQDTLVVSEGIPAEILNAKLPRLILQPLVENAIKHGISKTDGVGSIGIFAHKSADMLIVEIKDNGALQPTARISEEQDGFGIGLRNTRARLQQSYGDKQSLSLAGHPDGGVVATIALPFHTETASVRTP
ncbi:MAG: histidine kinase [Steroidobacteraceae bacterium]